MTQTLAGSRRSVQGPLYFGPPAALLFGIHDAPQAEAGRERSVVLCYPHGRDYVSAFRAYRALALRLARAGFHVLRFDYRHTGDSAGDVGDVSLQQWMDDIVAAVDEIRRSTGHASVSLVGLRLGATLAAMAARACRDVDRLVLWEPVVRGDEYVATLRARHREWFQAVVRRLARMRPLATEDELLGYPFAETLRNDLQRVDLSSFAAGPARHVLILGQQDDAEHTRLAQRLQERGAAVAVQRVAGPQIWSTIPGMDQGLVPNRVLQAIVDWLGSPGRD